MADGGWFVVKNKQKWGPYSLPQIQQMAVAGQIQQTDMLLPPGTQKWVAASTFPHFFRPGPQAAPMLAAAPGSTAPSSSKLTTTWAKLSTPARWAIAGSAGLLLMTMMCCCGGVFLGTQSDKAARQDLAEAENLWSAGKKAEAVAKYKSVLKDHLHVIDESQQPTVFQRVIEFEVESGNASSAKQLIEKALKNKISLSLSNPEAKRLYVEVEEEQQAKQLAESKPQKGKKGAKLAAFKKVVAKLAKFPDPLEGSVVHEKFNKELGPLIDEFASTPFDAKSNRAEAKEIVTLYEAKVEGRYTGLLIQNLEKHVANIVSELLE